MSDVIDSVAPLIDSEDFKALDNVGKADFREKAFSLVLQDPEKKQVFDALPDDKKNEVQHDFLKQFNERYGDKFQASGFQFVNHGGLVEAHAVPDPIRDPVTERMLATGGKDGDGLKALADHVKDLPQDQKDEISAVVRKRYGDAVPNEFSMPKDLILQAKSHRVGRLDDPTDPLNYPNAIPAAVRMAGAMVPPAVASYFGGPVGLAASSGLALSGAAAVEPAAQYLEKKVFGTRQDYSVVEGAINAGVSAIPGAPLGKFAPGLAKVGVRAAEGALIGGGQELLKQAILPDRQVDLGEAGKAALMGLGIGGAFGAIEGGVLKWAKGEQSMREQAIGVLDAHAREQGYAGKTTEDLKAWYRERMPENAPKVEKPVEQVVLPDEPPTPALIETANPAASREPVEVEPVAPADTPIPAEPAAVTPQAPGETPSDSVPAQAQAEAAPAVSGDGQAPATPAEKVKKSKTVKVGNAPSGEMDLLTHIEDLGGVRSPRTISNKGGEYDGFGEAFNSGPGKLLIRKGSGSKVDALLGELKERGYNFNTPDELYSAVKKTVADREKEAKRLGDEDYGAKFDAALMENTGRKTHLNTSDPVSVDSLSVGDEFRVRGEPVKVVDVDPDSGAVKIKDGVEREIPAGTDIYPDKGEVTKVKGELFGDDTPFNLGNEEQKEPSAPVAKNDSTPDMFGDSTRSTPPTALDKANAAARETGTAGLKETLSEIPTPPAKSVKEALGEAVDESRKMGITPGNVQLQSVIDAVSGSVKSIAKEISSVPKITNFKTALLNFNGARQQNSLELTATVKDLKRTVPDIKAREGISNWIDAGGDVATLQQWAKATTSLSLRKGYEAAMNLTPDQVKIAEGIQQFYKDKFSDGVANGIFAEKLDNGARNEGLDNYVTHIVAQPFVGGSTGSLFGGKLARTFKFSKERTFPNFFELEQAGFRAATKDIAQIVAVYGNEIDKTIQTRKFVRDLLTKKNEAGEPLAVVIGGNIIKTEEPDANLITPSKTSSKAGETYRSINHPALRNWKWIGEDTNGAPVMMLGEIGLHPDIREHVENVLGRSAIQRWYGQPGSEMNLMLKRAAKTIDMSNRLWANTMLGAFSGFHPVHLIKRAAGNRINPFNLLPLDHPMVGTAVRRGLVLAGDNDAAQLFADGFGHGSLFNHFPLLGQWNKQFTDFTFHNFIPRLKLTAWVAIRERNTKLLADQIGRGEIRQQDVDYLTALQVNARFGHMNYTDMGRNPTMQHIARMLTLAPDFWESNIRNYGQVIQGMTGKVGREPLLAFAFTLAAIWTTARVLNELFDGQPHWDEPFGVVAGGRRYTMRNEVEDLWRMVTNWRGYINGRLSPIFGSMGNALSGTNWRGEKQTTLEAFKDYLTKIVPISLRWVPGIRELTETGKANPISRYEEFLGSLGLQISRHSPINDAYKLATEFNKAQGVPEDRGTYPVSRYQALRYALEDNKPEAAMLAMQRLIKDDPSLNLIKIATGFKASLFHPFTGNSVREALFYRSLQGKDREAVAKAVAQRSEIWTRFNKVLPETARQLSSQQHR